MEKANKPIFFILGRPRSGTSLLQVLFDAHPNVNIPPESPVILFLARKFANTKNWDEKTIKDLIQDLNTIPRIRSWHFDSILLEKALKAQAELNFQKCIEIIYLLYTSIFKKEQIKILGDKNPAYSKYPKKLLELYPTAKFIHIVRDYRDHILSMQKTNLQFGNPYLIAKSWKQSQKQILELKQQFPNKFYSIKYEDFIDQPEQQFENLCNFLEIPYNPLVFDFYKQKEKYIERFPKKASDQFHKNLFKPVAKGYSPKWYEKMDEATIKIADAIVGDLAEKSGYKRKNSQPNLLFLLKVKTMTLINYFSIGVRMVFNLSLSEKQKKKRKNIGKWVKASR